VSAEKFAAHLAVDRYGDFLLTDAIRPALCVPVVPRQGYRRDVYRDDRAAICVPVLASAVSREHLFEVFLDLVGTFEETIDVVLETSHNGDGKTHRDLLRESIDRAVLMSHFCDFEDLLLNDGCTGVAVISTAGPQEVQFDEHKLLVVYGRNLAPFEKVFQQWGVPRDDTLRLITEGEHLHSTDPRYAEQFEQLCCRLGVAEPAERVSW
jgi:hypothetical protein